MAIQWLSSDSIARSKRPDRCDHFHLHIRCFYPKLHSSPIQHVLGGRGLLLFRLISEFILAWTAVPTKSPTLRKEYTDFADAGKEKR